MKISDMIDRLINVKLSIIENADDVLWLRGVPSTTVCEEIDQILTAFGVDPDELYQHYENQNRKALVKAGYMVSEEEGK